MSTTGQFSSKNPTIKRILKEAAELAHSPSQDYHAAPLESDLFEWHFTLCGPPAPSPYAGGIYHGRIVLPPAYPLKPPSFRFTTPSGRFEVNREICLSISGHHEETWQPAWGIRTALVAIRSFMDTDAKGQLGGMDASEEARRRFAGQSRAWRCPTCARTNEEVMAEQGRAVEERGAEGGKGEVVPEELRLAYREDLGKGKQEDKMEEMREEDAAKPEPEAPVVSPNPPATTATPPDGPVVQTAPPARQVQQQVTRDIPAWIDQTIYGVLLAIAALLWLKFAA